MWCCVVLCFVVLVCFVVWCGVVWCGVLCCLVLSCVPLCVALSYVVLCVVFYLLCVVLSCVVLCCVVLCVVLYPWHRPKDIRRCPLRPLVSVPFLLRCKRAQQKKIETLIEIKTRIFTDIPGQLPQKSIICVFGKCLLQ